MPRKGDYGDELADLIVDFLNAPERSFSFVFNAVNPEDPVKAANREPQQQRTSPLEVFVVPLELRQTIVDRGRTLRCDSVIGVYVQKYLTDGTSRRPLSFLVREIRESLQRVDQGSWAWSTKTTNTLFDYAAFAASQKFYSQFQITYFDTIEP